MTPVHFSLNEAVLDQEDLNDIIVSIDREAVVVITNIELSATELCDLTAIVWNLAKARNCHGAKLVIDRLMVREPGADGIARLDRMRIVGSLPSAQAAA